MEGKQDASIEAEGQFGKPEFFARSGVNARMDSKFPHHPLMPSEASYKKNVEAAELNMLRKTMGAAMPLKLSMERKACSKVGHLPCLSAGRSMASLEALTGADMVIGFDDVYGKAEDFEMLPPLPFNAIQKTLDEF
jgi:hypothetical protein